MAPRVSGSTATLPCPAPGARFRRRLGSPGTAASRDRLPRRPSAFPPPGRCACGRWRRQEAALLLPVRPTFRPDGFLHDRSPSRCPRAGGFWAVFPTAAFPGIFI